MKRKLTFSKAINEALEISLKRDRKVIVLGLGVDDPKGIFGTTKDLKKKFKSQVFDMPTAENGFTGFSLGLAISGYKPIITHQRVEFSLLSLEQIFNQIAKWFYMSNGKVNVPLVIRLIIGKGWGQGPQHSQSLESIFSHIPGLKVVSPHSAYDAKGLLINSIKDPDPVIFFEHRWLHETNSIVPKKSYEVKLGKGNILKRGKDITIVSFSYAVIECLKALKELKKYKVSADIIDLRTIKPIDYKLIFSSVRKTKKLLIVDNGLKDFGIGSEISSKITEKFNIPINILGVPNIPIPSSPAISKYCYPSVNEIIKSILDMLKIKIKFKKTSDIIYGSDQPDKNFTGPF